MPEEQNAGPFAMLSPPELAIELDIARHLLSQDDRPKDSDAGHPIARAQATLTASSLNGTGMPPLEFLTFLSRGPNDWHISRDTHWLTRGNEAVGQTLAIAIGQGRYAPDIKAEYLSCLEGD